MRKGWKYKRIGDVCSVIGGATPKTEIKEFWGGSHYWITPADLNGNKYQGATPRTITDVAVQKTNLQLLPVGTVLLSSRAPIGKVAITTEAMYCNQGFKNIVCSGILNNEFVYWYLYFSKDYLNSLGTGATFKEISKKTTENIMIPVPPLQEQERIVAELDLLTEIIDKQKQQLKELDTLAKSIFYDMFGNPNINDMKWDYSTFKSIFKLKSGDGLIGKNFMQGNYPVYGGNGISGYHNKYNKDGDYIIVGRVGAYCGNVRYVKGQFWLTDNAFQALFDNTVLDYVFVCYLLNAINLHQYANQAAQPVISNVVLKDIQIIMPPKAIQREFAKKIQTIESQKQSINRSIAESQKLFDYTMDKYFG